MTPPQEALAEIRARLEAASPGPWWEAGSEVESVAVTICANYYVDIPEAPIGPWPQNATFIAHSREDVAALLRVAEAAQDYRTTLVTGRSNAASRGTWEPLELDAIDVAFGVLATALDSLANPEKEGDE